LLDIFLCNVGVFTTEKKGRAVFTAASMTLSAGTFFLRERIQHSLQESREPKISRCLEGNGLRDGSWSGDATIVDFNEDGFPDLYVLNMQGDNHYYENQAEESSSTRQSPCFRKRRGARWE
jgi:hypothetical protein